MEYISRKYGLVTDTDLESENGQLFLVELIFLSDLLNKESEYLKSIMIEQLQLSKVSDGLYSRNPDLSDRRILSHDNLTAIFAWSYLAKTEHRFSIWKYLLKHLGTYDNSRGKTKQLSRFLPFNPANFFIWGLCAESNIYLLFLPFYLVNLIISSNKPKEDTSGKILSWVELYPHRNHWLVKRLYDYYHRKMQNQYDIFYVPELMRIYHGNNSPEFPIRKILGV